MSRMNRYKHVHEESERTDRSQIFARKELNKKPQHENLEEPAEEVVEVNQQSTPARSFKIRSPFKKNSAQTGGSEPQPKKRKKHRFLRCILTLLILLLAYSGISFYIGQQVAKRDPEITVKKETFNGLASPDGGNNILLIGNDSREGENARADTIMVLQLDGPAKKPKLISFMRDTLVTIPGVGDNKMNAAYAYGGAELVRTTLQQNFGLETKYYTTVDFKTFEKVIDTLFPFGVKIDAEKNMSENLEVPIQQGMQRMDGLTLLQYTRFRMDEEGDFGRVRRQQQAMSVVFQQIKNPISVLKLPYAAGKVLGYASTDLSIGFLLKNTFSIARGAGGIDRLSVPVEDSWTFGSTYEAGSVLIIDPESNRQEIRSFLAK